MKPVSFGILEGVIDNGAYNVYVTCKSIVYNFKGHAQELRRFIRKLDVLKSMRGK